MVAAAALAAAVIALPGIARANFSATGSGNATVGATTLRNASAFTSTCTAGSNKGPIALGWTASPDAYVTSYVITRSVNGGAPTPITVLAPATSYSDVVNPNKNDVFTYTIRAVAQSWTTAALPAAAAASFTGNGGKCV